jgi:hypothetical protein
MSVALRLRKFNHGVHSSPNFTGNSWDGNIKKEFLMINNIRNTVLIIGIFLLAAGGLSAQIYEELPFDTAVSGHLLGERSMSWGDAYWYRVQALQDGFLTVETGGDTQTTLEAYDSLYRFFKKDEGSKDGRNARVEIFAKAGATYYFKLRGSSYTTRGPYDIWASSRPIPPEMELPLDTIATGYIRSRERPRWLPDIHWYCVRPVESGYITVQTMGTTRTYLEAYDLSNRLIGANDNGGERGNAILEIPVEAGQTYMFKLRGDDGNASGNYSIRASFDRSRSSGYRYR